VFEIYLATMFTMFPSSVVRGEREPVSYNVTDWRWRFNEIEIAHCC
jgi:hypothetical protein